MMCTYEVVTRGQASDAEAIHGLPARCDNLLDQGPPDTFGCWWLRIPYGTR